MTPIDGFFPITRPWAVVFLGKSGSKRLGLLRVSGWRFVRSATTSESWQTKDQQSCAYEQGVGHKLLKRPKVQAALSEVMCHLGMTPEWIKCLIMEIAAGADMADFEPYLQGEKMLGQLRQDGVNTRFVRKARRTVEKDGSEHFTLVLADPMPALKELVRIYGLICLWRRCRTMSYGG